MKEIQLASGRRATVDDDDFTQLAAHRWHVWVRRRPNQLEHCYAATVVNGKAISMHRLLLGAPHNYEVDHRDGNGLNNQRSNLRLCSRQENTRNQRLSLRSKSGFKGVTMQRKRAAYAKPWNAYIEVNKRTIHLGYFSEPQAAAAAYDEAALRHFGEFAKTNRALGLLP